MKTRLDLLDSLPKFSKGAELGVFAGDFSREILTRIQPSQFFMVDLFDGEVESGDVNGQNFRTVDMELQQGVLEKEFAALIQQGVVSIEKENAWEWLSNLGDSTLDWAYIDCSHKYQPTVRELEASWSAVKHGGFICGHDYHAGWFPDVVQAVGEFCDKHGLTKELTTEDGLASYRIHLLKS